MLPTADPEKTMALPGYPYQTPSLEAQGEYTDIMGLFLAQSMK